MGNNLTLEDRVHIIEVGIPSLVKRIEKLEQNSTQTAKSRQVEKQVSRDFCGLTTLEKKELEIIWNKLTDYGEQPMTYNKYLDAGLEIMTMSYLTGKRDSKNSG